MYLQNDIRSLLSREESYSSLAKFPCNLLTFCHNAVVNLIKLQLPHSVSLSNFFYFFFLCGPYRYTQRQDVSTITLAKVTHRPSYWYSVTASLAKWLGRQPREQKILGSNPACTEIFLGSSHTSDLKIGTPVATLPGIWHSKVSTGTGQPGVSILCLGEIESLVCNFYLSVATRKIVWADPSLRYTCMLLGR